MPVSLTALLMVLALVAALVITGVIIDLLIVARHRRRLGRIAATAPTIDDAAALDAALAEINRLRGNRAVLASALMLLGVGMLACAAAIWLVTSLL